MPVAFEIPAAFGSAGGARAGLGERSPRSLRISIPRTIVVSRQGPVDLVVVDDPSAFTQVTYPSVVLCVGDCPCSG